MNNPFGLYIWEHSMKCILTDVSSEASCAWCSKKTDCVEASIEATFFKKNLLCWKCLRKALEMRSRQEHLQATDKTTLEKTLKS